MKHPRPDLDRELVGLKDFQLATVNAVSARLWDETSPARRFLVADEVGLGKTLIARGVIAQAIDQLWDTVDRIDVVYICSNSQIAQQNLARLRVGAEPGELPVADRLTMLAKEIHRLQGKKLNFISFTPGTSFDISTGGGQAPERVLLYWLLHEFYGREIKTERWLQFFRGGASRDNFERRARSFNRAELSPEFVEEFSEALRTATGPLEGQLADELFECVHEFKGRRRGWRPPTELSRRRYHLVGRLRRLLARAAVSALEPDIVILDEFQRFKQLLVSGDDEVNEAAELAQELFNYEDARLILLSATPYKMYTLPDEPEGDDHYDDFIRTVRFLSNDATALDVQHGLSGLRSALYAGDLDAAVESKNRVEGHLRRFMVRTERLAATPDRDGMISESGWQGVELTSDDVRDYRRLAHTSKTLKSFDPLEFWRSSPYVLELMEAYKLKKALQAADQQDPDLLDALKQPGNRLRHDDINRYRALDPGNAKMRGLINDLVVGGAWKLAWIPPSLPYYDLAGPYADPSLMRFTKRLVFSSWAVVPKAIGTVVSYEAERQLMAAAGQARRYHTGRRQTALLTFQVSAGRRTGMPVLGMLYPSVALARMGDPLDVARQMGRPLPLSLTALREGVSRRITGALDSLPSPQRSGPSDDSWYWATGMMLDRAEGLLGDYPMLSDFSFGFSWGPDEGVDTRFDDHVRAAQGLRLEDLGPRPEDLMEVLTDLAVAGPGVTAMRALARVSRAGDPLGDFDLRNNATCIAWALRNLFNRPELMALVRGAHTDDQAYWRDVLGHCVAGGLQPVLDEYAHVLNESLGVSEHADAERWSRIATEIDTALSTRTSVNKVDEVKVSSSGLELDSRRMRSHFAVRFGRGVSEDAAVQREGQVRSSYNSPFWPFVLASTSVGQEGLDFHQYSHAVVHWNLPGNPVDLEQREGRVHRYKGHAVRKNVAQVYGARPEVLDADDPWSAMFALAAADRPEGESEIWPFWVFPLEGGASIERYVPTLPLSKEAHAYRRLMRTVGAYRMVFGQPRQEDLLRYLGDRIHELDGLRIDLSP